MQHMILKLILASSSLLIASCIPKNNITEEENVAQLLIGRPYSDLRSCLGIPENAAGDVNEGMAYWSREIETEIPHYVSGKSHSSSSYNAFTNTLTTTTTSSPSYTYYTREKRGFGLIAHFSQRKAISVDFYSHKLSLPLPTWEKNNEAFLAWNRANANDELDDLLKLETSYPILASKQYRIMGCLQAAKFDSAELLSYYLSQGGVSLDDRAETWAKGANAIATKYVLTEASVREILQSRNAKNVRKKLAELGLSF